LKIDAYHTREEEAVSSFNANGSGEESKQIRKWRKLSNFHKKNGEKEGKKERNWIEMSTYG